MYAVHHSTDVSLIGQGHVQHGVIHVMDAYGQSGPSSASSISFWAASTRVDKQPGGDVPT